MGLVSCGRSAVGALALLALLVGCGGSVADADSSGAVRTTRAVPTQSAPFCAAVAANSDAVRPLSGLAQRGTVPADRLNATVAAARASGAELLGTAPDEIRPDVRRTVDALNTELTALLAAGGDAAAASRDPEVAAQLSSPAVAASSQRVSTYVGRNCQLSR